MNKKIIIFFLLFLAACQSTQGAFTLKKKSSADEFLVEKKSPLVLPPDYGKLPVPQENTEDIDDDNKDLKELLGSKKNKDSSEVQTNSSSTSIKKSILEKIQ